jgi:hypothetical protein
LLEQQDNKSETDIARIQTLLYIQEDPSIINALLQQQVDATKDVLKYGGMDDVLR